MTPSKRRKPPALFVYGSLMSKKYWRDILGAGDARALKIVPAKLKGWRRWWNGHRPSYGGAVLNMKRATNASMWGGLVTGLTDDVWKRLDKQERSHLPRGRVFVVTAGGKRVFAYTYRQKPRGPEGIPTAGYVAAVLAGAKALGRTASNDVRTEVKRLRETMAAAKRSARSRR